MRFLGLDITGKAWKVWARDKAVFMKTYKTNFIPPFLEPVLYFLALGFGLGAFINEIDGVSYVKYIAPGLIAISIMYSSFFECTYGSFVRMYYQKTFDAIVATPLTMDEVIAGEILWGGTKSMINGTIVTFIILLFGFASIPHVFLIPILAFFGGVMFASLAMLFTSITPNIDSFNYPMFLLITPMFLFSGTFFPLSILPQAGQALAQALPLTHVVTIARGIAYGSMNAELLISVGYIALVTLLFFVLSIRLMKKRLIK
ncbi:MAG: ABC transporter permease [Thermoplasmata archaeon]|nr:ABC transporter permease [Thermoplasmata archaeon]